MPGAASAHGLPIASDVRETVTDMPNDKVTTVAITRAGSG